MSNKQWDDLPSQDLTPDDVKDLNIDDILNEIKYDWLKPEKTDVPEEPVTPPQPENVTSKKEPEEKSGGWQKHFLVYLHDLVYLLSALVVIFLLLFRVVVVSGRSMNNTLYDGDYLLLLGSTFYHNPSSGDVVVVSKESFNNGDPIVKRVIATEGQWVEIKNGIVYVGDTPDSMLPLDESYTIGYTREHDRTDPFCVSEGCLFVMGDNRENSMDSRYTTVGLVDKREVLGKVFFLFIPGSNYGEEEPDFGRVGVVD